MEVIEYMIIKVGEDEYRMIKDGVD